MTKAILPLALLFALSSAEARPRRRHHPKPPPAPAPAAEAPAPSETPSPPPEPPAAPAPQAAAPAPAEETPPERSAPSTDAVDLQSLNDEYNAIRDELFRSRAKVELLGSALYKTKLTATFQYKAQRAWPLKRVTLRVDDQPVYGADAPSAEDPIQIYQGFAAPGRHTVTVRVECNATGSSRLTYATEDSFTFDVPDGKQEKIELVADETGSGPEPIADKHDGSFDVEVKAKLQAIGLNEK